MSWINRAEAKFGHIAIPGLPRIIVGFNALVFLLYNLNPYFLQYLTLDPDMVMKGQVWRLVTYIFIPSFGGFLPGWLSAAFYLLFLWFVANGCEEAFGPFKFTWYYLTGMIGITAAAFFFGGNFSNILLNTSLLFAFARFYPEVVIYLFYVLPVKVKWLAWFTAAVLILEFLGGSMEYRIGLIVALANYFLFFGPGLVAEARQRNEIAARRRRFEQEARTTDTEPLHRCAVCDRTEISAPQLEFRVAKDGQEYCMEHLPKPSEVAKGLSKE